MPTQSRRPINAQSWVLRRSAMLMTARCRSHQRIVRQTRDIAQHAVAEIVRLSRDRFIAGQVDGSGCMFKDVPGAGLGAIFPRQLGVRTECASGTGVRDALPSARLAAGFFTSGSGNIPINISST